MCIFNLDEIYLNRRLSATTSRYWSDETTDSIAAAARLAFFSVFMY